MKLLHTSDWHLGKRLENFSRMEEQQAVLEEICEIADHEQVDAVMVAGDLFDTFNPPTEAVDIFYKFIKRLANKGQRPVIAIAGNHDSPDRIEAPDPLARECGIIFVGYPDSIIPEFELPEGTKITKTTKGFIELKLPRNKTPLRILLTPYANEFRLKTCLGTENKEETLRKVLRDNWQELADKYCDNKGVNLLVSHLFMIKKGDELPEEPEDEKPILHVGGVQAVFSENIPKQVQYTALGHLHRLRQVDSEPGPVYYSGSPLSYNFSETDQEKFVLIVEAEPGEKAMVHKKKLYKGKKLIRYRAEGIEQAIEWLHDNQDCLVELTMVTENFMSAQERRRLSAAHNYIITIIPEVKSADAGIANNKKEIDLKKNMDVLFRDYFNYSKGQEPNEEIMELFSEILSEDEHN
jgi:DNA repair protein SbcD/Mre11